MTSVALPVSITVSWVMKKPFRNKAEDEMGTPHCILAVHQYEKAVWMYCTSELHKGLYEARIRPRER